MVITKLISILINHNGLHKRHLKQIVVNKFLSSATEELDHIDAHCDGLKKENYDSNNGNLLFAAVNDIFNIDNRQEFSYLTPIISKVNF